MITDSLNLYIDESGSGAIYEPRKEYRYFLMAGIVMSSKEEERVTALMKDWRKKYLKNKGKAFHASDFYEDHEDRKGNPIANRKRSLNDIKKFEQASEELFKIILKTRLKARVYYIDLIKMRRKLDLQKYIDSGPQNFLKDVVNKEFKGEILFPIVAVTKRLYEYHADFLAQGKKLRNGIVCYESQKENDVKIVESFHDHLEKNHTNTTRPYRYGGNVVGVQFYTKASMCSALEIADLVAFTNTQILRLRNSKKELVIDKGKEKILIKHYDKIKSKFRIRSLNLTDKCIEALLDIKARYGSKYTKKASPLLAFLGEIPFFEYLENMISHRIVLVKSILKKWSKKVKKSINSFK